MGPITPYYDDPSVTEIMINGPEEVFNRRQERRRARGRRPCVTRRLSGPWPG